MKTRIIIREFNDARKEFECQRNIFKQNIGVAVICFFIPIFWGIIPKLFYDPMTHSVKKPNDSYGWELAIFSTMEEAKAFIDAEIQKEVDEEFAKYQKQVKKTFKVKYP